MGKYSCSQIRGHRNSNGSVPKFCRCTIRDGSIVFIGKHDFWNKIISVNTETNRPRILEPYRRIFGLDFNNIILWLQFLKVFSFKYHDCVINETMTNKVALEKNIDNILKCAHIAISDEVLTVHELSRINHPNAPSATDKPEPDPAPSVANDPEITTDERENNELRERDLTDR